MKNRKKSRKRAWAPRFLAMGLLCAVMAGFFSVSASAQTLPNDNYSYYWWDNETYPVSGEPMYAYEATISGSSLGLTSLDTPSDVFVDKQGMVYISDSKNGRVVVVNPDNTLNRVIDSFTWDGQPLELFNVQGVFADGKNLYIADKGNVDGENQHVLVLGEGDRVVRLLGIPEDEVVPPDFNFQPTKVAVDSDGIVYVVSDGSYYGAVRYSPDGEFQGFYGSSPVKGTIFSGIQRMWDYLFPNEAKRATATKKLPYQFTDISIDSANFVYTSTGAFNNWESHTGQLRKLSPGGSNILLRKNEWKAIGSDSYQFVDVQGSVKGLNETRINNVVTMDVDSRGFLYAGEATYGRIYVYDQECNLITVFGGGVKAGDQQGTFRSMASLAVSPDNRVYVCDAVNNSVTVYRETAFGALFKNAQDATIKGEYDEALPLWEDVQTHDRNHRLPYRGLSKAYVSLGEYDKALEYAKLGDDTYNYAQAFYYVRNNWLSENLLWLAGLALLLAAGVTALVVLRRKGRLRLPVNENVSLMLSSVTHPFTCFQRIKYEKKGSIGLGILMLGLFFGMTVASDLYAGFIYNGTKPQSYNVLFPFLTTVGLVLLWVIVNWGLGILFGGKGTMKQIFLVAAYSIIPQIVELALFLILSHIITPDEEMILSVLFYGCWILTLVILCIGTMVVHDIGFFKFLGIAVITVVGMLIVVFILFMLAILMQQFATFIVTLVNEINLR